LRWLIVRERTSESTLQRDEQSIRTSSCCAKN